MSKRKRRRHRDNRGRKHTRRSRRVSYNRRKKGGYRRKARKGRKCGRYACFVQSMWKKHRAAYKRLGVGGAGKAIAKAWKSKGR